MFPGLFLVAVVEQADTSTVNREVVGSSPTIVRKGNVAQSVRALKSLLAFVPGFHFHFVVVEQYKFIFRGLGVPEHAPLVQ